jgi:sulfoxide reductase heme-binding subunit YedZ
MSAITAVASLTRNPAGRFSWMKTVVLIGAILPGAWIAWRWGTVGLGARGVNTAIHLTGTWAVRFLLLSLAVTPARYVLDLARVTQVRRMLGVTAACYAVAHLILYIIDNNGNLVHVASEIVLRFYLTIGFVALLGLLALAITSTDGWQAKLGRDWKKLHRLVFPIAVLALFHHFLQSKADVSTPVFAAGVFVWLMLWRAEPRPWRAWRAPLLALAVLAGLAAAAIEALWYGLATGISGWRVLHANLNLTHGPRPAEWVALVGLGVLVLSLGRPLWRAAPSGRRRREAPGGDVSGGDVSGGGVSGAAEIRGRP